jgi:seryl-tRNA synthetase
MFVVTSPEESDAVFEELLAVQRALYDELELPYRQLEMPTEELGAAAHRKVDTEAWMPGRDGYGEICSTSNCTDYQSRRLRVRMKRSGDGRRVYPHMLNGTACAVPRVIVAILENGQNADGSIDLPRALHGYLPYGMTRINPPRM